MHPGDSGGGVAYQRVRHVYGGIDRCDGDCRRVGTLLGILVSRAAVQAAA